MRKKLAEDEVVVRTRNGGKLVDASLRMNIAPWLRDRKKYRISRLVPKAKPQLPTTPTAELLRRETFRALHCYGWLTDDVLEMLLARYGEKHR